MRYMTLLCILITGCCSNIHYCGVEYSDNYDLSRGILPYPPTLVSRVVINYNYKNIKSNPFYYSANTF